MAGWKTDRSRRSFEEAYEVMERDEGYGSGNRGARFLPHGCKRSSQSQSTGTQGQGGQGVDNLLFGGHIETMRS